MISKILKIEPDNRLTLEEILTHKFISDIVPNAKNRLILPENVVIEPFIISKMNPEENKNIKDDYDDINDITNEIYLNDDSKKLFEKLNESYNNLTKVHNDVLIQKKINENQNAKLIEYLKQNVDILQKEINKKLEINLNQAKQISLLEEDKKYLNQQIENLKSKLAIKDKQIEELKLYKEKNENSLNNIKRHNQIYSDEFLMNKSNSVKEIEENSNYYYNNLLLFYQKENKKLNDINDKYLSIINELKEKIVKLEITNSQLNNNNIEQPIFKLLKENEILLEKKEKKINKFESVIENISNFIEKINFETFNVEIPIDHSNNLDSINMKNVPFYKNSMSNEIEYKNNFSESNEK